MDDIEETIKATVATLLCVILVFFLIYLASGGAL